MVGKWVRGHLHPWLAHLNMNLVGSGPEGCNPPVLGQDPLPAPLPAPNYTQIQPKLCELLGAFPGLLTRPQG